jgi:pentapeptide MXKDX repeat protein
MTRMIVLSVPFLRFGLLFALPAQAEDSTTKTDATHISKPAHHMKKGAMMHKDSMKKDTMTKDDATQK